MGQNFHTTTQPHNTYNHYKNVMMFTITVSPVTPQQQLNITRYVYWLPWRLMQTLFKYIKTEEKMLTRMRVFAHYYNATKNKHRKNSLSFTRQRRTFFFVDGKIQTRWSTYTQ